MKLRILGTTGAVALAVCAIALYALGPVRASNHQDTPTLVARPPANITDMYIIPSPANASNVVFVMNVDPLIAPGSQTTTAGLDPAVMYQFKIAHSSANGPEDMVIQLAATGTGPSQTVTLYGPAAPSTTGANSTFVGATGTFPYNQATTLPNGIQAFVGPRADPFFFDLLQFFSFLPDRLYSNPRTGNTLGSSTPTFNGFAAGTLSGTGGYACSTNAASNALAGSGAVVPGGANVIAIVLEIPRAMISPAGTSQVIHVWSTTSTVSGT